MFAYRDLEAQSEPEHNAFHANPAVYQACLNKMSTIDIAVRITFTFVLIANFVYRSYENLDFYNDARKRIMMTSALIVLLGIQNCSVVFYPWVREKRFLLYMTFFVLYIFTSLKTEDKIAMLQDVEGDFVFKTGEFVVFLVLLPNITSLIFIVVLSFVLMVMFLIVNILARFGLIEVRLNLVGNNRTANRAQQFRERYLPKIEGRFYKEKQVEIVEAVSLLEENDIRSDDHVSIYKAMSCDMNIKDRYLSHKLKPAGPQVEMEPSAELCSICFGKFESTSFVYSVPTCGHTFHYGCITSWLKKNPSCPCCRSDILQYYQTNEGPDVVDQN